MSKPPPALLENGASPCVRDSAGAQPLFGAASEGNDSACKLLLDFGAEIAAKDNHARTGRWSEIFLQIYRSFS